MTWKLFIDDQLDDLCQPWRHVPPGWFGAKSVDEAITCVQLWGPPEAMDLDCDLGEGGEVKDFLKWLAEEHFNHPPKWTVHSKNGEAAKFVNSFMDSWHRSVDA